MRQLQLDQRKFQLVFPFAGLAKDAIEFVTELVCRVKQFHHIAAEIALFPSVRRMGIVGGERERQISRKVLVLPEERILINVGQAVASQSEGCHYSSLLAAFGNAYGDGTRLHPKGIVVGAS